MSLLDGRLQPDTQEDALSHVATRTPSRPGLARSAMVNNAATVRGSVDGSRESSIHTMQNSFTSAPDSASLRPPPAGRPAAMVSFSDTPLSTAPPSPNILPQIRPPKRQDSGDSINRVRATTLDIPGLTRSKVSPDGKISQRDVGSKLIIVMVGLPARGAWLSSP